MPAVVIGRTEVAARLLAYTEKDKHVQGKPRVLYAEGIRCRAATATSEFRALRVKHGTQGAMRKVRATFELAGEGEVATHVRITRPNGRRVWVEARADQEATHVRRTPVTDFYVRKRAEHYEPPREGEPATHLRVHDRHDRPAWAKAEPGQQATHVRRLGEEYYAKAEAEDLANLQRYGGYHYVPQSEAVHLIVSFGLDEVNPDDPEQVRRAFEFSVAMVRDLYPGAQAKLVGQADGQGMMSDGERLTDGGKFHVHVVLNATVAEAMTLDGKTWEAGRKLSGALTDIDRVRERVDEFIDAKGAAYGIVRNQVPVAEQGLEKRTAMDRRMAAKGGRASRNDRLRDAWWEAIEDSNTVDLDSFKQAMMVRGIEVTEPGWRRGKPPKVPRLSYQFEGVTTRGQSLGELYDHPSTLSLLESKVLTGELPMRPVRAKAGEAKPVRPLEADEPELAQQAARELARDAFLRRRVELWASREGVEVADLWQAVGGSMLDPAAKQAMWHQIEQREQTEAAELALKTQQWKVERAAERAEEARLEVEQAASEAKTEVEQVEDETVVAEVPIPEVTEVPEAAEPEPTQPRFDEASWAKNPPTKPKETFTEAGNRGASVDEMLAIGRAWDEWRAYAASDTYAEHQRAAEEARRAVEQAMADAEERANAAADELAKAAAEEQAKAAKAAEAAEAKAAAEAAALVAEASKAVESSAEPSAPTGPPPFVSALRAWKAKTVEGQKRIDELAELDEAARARLLADKRLVEEDLKPLDVGPKTLERYGLGFCDPVREQLELRTTKREAAKAAFESRTPRGKALAEQLREEISLSVYEDLSSLAPNPRKDIVESARDELAAELAEREDRDRGG